MTRDENATVLIATDSPDLSKYLVTLVRRLRPGWKVASETASMARVKAALARHDPDLSIFDLRLPANTTLETILGLRDNHPVIFVTQDRLLAEEVFTCRAVDFVIKPVRARRFAQALAKATSVLQEFPRAGIQTLKPDSWVSMKSTQGKDWPPIDEVCYFQAHGKETRVVFRYREELLSMGILKAVEFLNGNQFWQIQRGIVINVKQIVAVKRNNVGRLEVATADRKEHLLVSKSCEYLFQDMFIDV